jgi:hypothetical protein
MLREDFQTEKPLIQSIIEDAGHVCIFLPQFLSPSGHGVASIPIWVLYSHAGPVGTAEDLSSQTTKSKCHVMCQVIQITCEVM